MSKILRKTAQLFGVNASSTQIEQFGSYEQTGSLIYSVDPAVIQGLSAWGGGWTAAQYQQIFAPYYQDRNGVDLVFLYQLAYILQQGIPEWDSATEYFIGSWVSSGGQMFIALQNSNLGNAPPGSPSGSNSFWRWAQLPGGSSAFFPTRTVFSSGSGNYTPPNGVKYISLRMVGGGGGGGSVDYFNSGPGGNGGNTTFGTYTAGGGGGSTGGITYIGGIGGVALNGDVNIKGANGQSGTNTSSYDLYGAGGQSKFGGAGAGIVGSTGNGNPAVANSGSGGGGDSVNATPSSGQLHGGGGGAGAYLEAYAISPALFNYSVGAGGAGGSYGGHSGGAGAAGIIIVDEFYI